MNLLVGGAYVLLGVGRNLPFAGLYFHGLGAADAAFLALTCAALLGNASREAITRGFVALRGPLLATLFLCAAAMTSLSVNGAIRGIEGKDIFEILKYLYLAMLMVLTCVWTKSAGLVPALGFVLGVGISGVVAMRNPMNPDVLGTPQIFNPNVIGNALASAIVFCSLAILRGRVATGSALAVGSAVIALFTFSKGTWLMTLLAIAACALALRRVGASRGMGPARALGYGGLLALVYLSYENWDLVSGLVQAKLVATEFDATAAEGGSFSARLGLLRAAGMMFLQNPLLGVGISNFEKVNRSLEGALGDAFYDDDNPNSAWAYVLGCMGLPAFAAFCVIFVWFIVRVHNAGGPHHPTSGAYTAIVGAVFVLGGSVQLEMLTAYYYWVALGVVAALSALSEVPERRTGATGAAAAASPRGDSARAAPPETAAWVSPSSALLPEKG